MHNKKPKLRVAHISAVFPPYWSGTSNVAYYNALELARRGHDIHVFTAQHHLNGYRDPSEVTVHRLWTPFQIGNAPFTPGLLSALRGFDLFHLHWPYIFGAELTWLSRILQSTPYVLTYHIDLISDRKKIFGIYQKIWGTLLTKGARKVLAVSLDHLKSSKIYPILKERREMMVEIPNGVDVELFNQSVPGDIIRAKYFIPKDAAVIIFVGAMDKAHEYKGVPDLLTAFNMLNNPKTWLMLVGDGDLVPEYRRIAATIPPEKNRRIIFTGSVAHSMLPNYYAAANICVLPSLQTESFGMVLAEAMACGKAVIASDLPGVRSLVSDQKDGFLVRPGKPAEIVKKLKLLIEYPSLQADFGASGYTKIQEKYSWQKVVNHLEDVYWSIL